MGPSHCEPPRAAMCYDFYITCARQNINNPTPAKSDSHGLWRNPSEFSFVVLLLTAFGVAPEGAVVDVAVCVIGDVRTLGIAPTVVDSAMVRPLATSKPLLVGTKKVCPSMIVEEPA